MLCRWDVRAYDIGLLMAALDYVLDLKALRLLNTIDYDYSVVDSKKFTDWLKALHELFIDVRVRWSSLKGYLRVEG
jgi:hypothetical protein